MKLKRLLLVCVFANAPITEEIDNDVMMATTESWGTQTILNQVTSEPTSGRVLPVFMISSKKNNNEWTADEDEPSSHVKFISTTAFILTLLVFV